jgi:glycosyltransferase involved in cell wall biosynthesis
VIQLTIVVMAYDEERNLGAVVRELRDEVDRLGITHEILIVDDGSTDGTGALADALVASRTASRAIHHAANRGLGGVYRTGFAEARGDLVTFYPADGQFPATNIAPMLRAAEDHDMVLGYIAGHRRSAAARLLSWGERVLYRLLVGPMPRFQGVLMFRRVLLARHALHSDGRGWGVLMELILRVSRARHGVVSVPTTLRPRLSGASKVSNSRTIVANARQILGLRSVLRMR